MHLLALEWTVEYFTQDPVGRRITAGVLLVAALLVLYLLLKLIARNAETVRKLIGVAIVLGIAVWAFGAVQSAGLVGIIVAGGIAFGMIIGLALFLTHR